MRIIISQPNHLSVKESIILIFTHIHGNIREEAVWSTVRHHWRKTLAQSCVFIHVYGCVHVRMLIGRMYACKYVLTV